MLCFSMILTSLFPIYGEEVIEEVESSIISCLECGLVDGHLDNCSFNENKEEDDSACNCDLIYSIHADTCPLFVVLEDEKEDVIEECICGTETDIHLEDCPLYEEIIVESDNLEEVSFEFLMEVITLSELYYTITDDTSIIDLLAVEEKEELSDRVNELYLAIEEPTEDDSRMKDELLDLLVVEVVLECEYCGLIDSHSENCELYICSECGEKEHLENCSKYIEVCSECLEKNGVHSEFCSLYICGECGLKEHSEECSNYKKPEFAPAPEKCEECQGENENHLESCSLFICSECGENKHTEDCSKFVDDRALFIRLLDSDLIGVYELLTDYEEQEEVNNLTEVQISEVIYYVGLIADDEDLETEILMLLYDLPNASKKPTTLEESDIYFDISFGDVVFTDTTYSGFNSTGDVISGEHKETNAYFVEQNSSAVTNYVISVGTEDTPVTVDFEIHLCGVNIDAPKGDDNHAPAVYVNTSSGYVYIIADDNTENILKAYGSIFTNGSGSSLKPEANRFGHAAIEKEIGTKGYLVVTCEEGFDLFRENHNKGHDCTANGVCGVINARAIGEAGFKSGNTRTSAAAAIGSKAEVSDTSDKRTSLSGAPTMGTLYNLRICGGKITATGSTGNYNTNTALGGSPGIGVGAGFQQYSIGYATDSFRIYGGYINAIAGDGSSACIGGGYHAGKVVVTIYGGTIFANSKLTNSKDIQRGAGIGGGGGGSTSNATAGATVYIRGGTIYAHSEFGAAIGSGAGGSSGTGQVATIDITGGTIYATTTKSTGNGAGAAIGSGGSTGSGKGGKATITISGGTIYASSELGADIGGGGTNSTTSSAVGGESIITISGGNIEAMTGGIGGGNANAGKGGNATLTISGGIINASSINGGNSKKNNGGSATVLITDGILNTGSIGGGTTDSSTAKIGSAAVEITGGEIHGQVIMDSTNLASGVECSFKMSGGTIDMSNPNSDYDFSFSEDNGAVVYIIGSGESTEEIAQLTGGIIRNGSAENGGAIYIAGGGSMLMSGGKIENCTANSNGGAVYISGGDFTMTGGTIEDCTADNGGALYVYGGNINMTAGLIDNNEAISNGGGIYVESESIDVIVAIDGGVISNNYAGNNGGAVGANLLGTSKCYISVGLEDCKCANPILHQEGVCPEIKDNLATISGGAFYCQSVGNTESTDINDHILIVDLFCSNIHGNGSTKFNGSNSLHEENGYFTIYAGEIDDGFLVDGGVFRDLRPKKVTQMIRYWSNYDGGPAECYEEEFTVGLTIFTPIDIYNRDGHLLSGWARSEDGTEGFIPIGGQYTVVKEDGYVDFYAIWDSQTSFIIYIPESFTISEETGIAQSEISADLQYFSEGDLLTITVNSDFELTNGVDTIPFAMRTSEPGITGDISNGGTVATFSYNNTVDKLLTVIVKFKDMLIGSFSGEITFNVDFHTDEDD